MRAVKYLTFKLQKFIYIFLVCDFRATDFDELPLIDMKKNAQLASFCSSCTW